MKQETTITDDHLMKLASTTTLSYPLIKGITRNLDISLEQSGKKLTLSMLEKHLEWVIDNNITHIDSYMALLSKYNKGEEKENAIIRDNELRKKLGYNNSEWKTVKALERNMVIKLKSLLSEYIARDINVKGDKDKEEANLKNYDTLWRNHARGYLIPNYPRAKHDPKVRIKILGLFLDKLKELTKDS